MRHERHGTRVGKVAAAEGCGPAPQRLRSCPPLTPAGAVSRSLFKKQSAAEAHGSDYGMPDDGKSLFSEPRPYDIHDPIEALPFCIVPV